MSLTNRQYDTIMRGYDHRQYRNYRIQCARREEIYKKLPRIQKVEEEISSCSLSHTEQILSLQETDPDNAHPEILTGLRRKLDALRQEKETLLGDAGYPADYLDMPYTCPDCQDTGYIGSRKCHCFLQEEIRLLYSGSRLEHVLSEENFSTLLMMYMMRSSRYLCLLSSICAAVSWTRSETDSRICIFMDR